MNSTESQATPIHPANAEDAADLTPEASATAEAGRIAELEAQVKEKEQKYLYLYADFDNFKKRVVKERSDLLKFGWENLARDLLLGVDNLERALHFSAPETDKNLLEGLKMVLSQFHSTLSKQGVQPIATKDTPFDPHHHEAVGTEPSDLPSGTILREELKGYTLHGRLLRPARVIVSAAKN